MIESFFNTIFGVCCHPDSCAYPVESSERTYKGVGQASNRNGACPLSIPQPPEIRRLALDDEDLSTMPDVARSGSLKFLFYQG